MGGSLCMPDGWIARSERCRLGWQPGSSDASGLRVSAWWVGGLVVWWFGGLVRGSGLGWPDLVGLEFEAESVSALQAGAP